MSNPSSVGEDFPVQQARVRELLVVYRDLGPAGRFGVAVLEQVLQRADRAAISGDPVAILAAYHELLECE